MTAEPLESAPASASRSPGEQGELEGLHPARALPPARRPKRATLRLPDGYRTSVYVHGSPHHPPCGRLPVLYVHGIQSHPGWFVGSAAALAGEGHRVFQITRRGSGDNRAARGHARSAGQLLDDLDAACRFALRRAGAERLHVVGVSWGGKLVAAYVAQGARSAWAASLTLVAPGIVPRVGVGRWTKIAIAGSLLVAPRRLFDIPLNDPTLFTDNEAMRRYLRSDPLALHRATAQFMLASRSLDRQLARARRGAVGLPTTLILAARDRIIDNDRTCEVVARLTADGATVERIEGAHVLEFEADPRGLHQAMASALRRAE